MCSYFIEPTIFTDVKPEMKIVKEEIFGPVVVVSKFKDQDDILAQANDTMSVSPPPSSSTFLLVIFDSTLILTFAHPRRYGLAAAVFSRDITHALATANALKAGTVWVNCYNALNSQVPFGGYKQSGIGRELGEYALANYTGQSSHSFNTLRRN